MSYRRRRFTAGLRSHKKPRKRFKSGLKPPRWRITPRATFEIYEEASR